MELLKASIKDNVKKDEIESVEEQKQEYKLIDSFSRTTGLKLYSYNPKDSTLFEVEILKGETIYIEIINGKMTPVDKEMQKAVVDSRFIYFESLNYNKAVNRVKKYRNDLTAMCNMKPVRDGEIKFW